MSLSYSLGCEFVQQIRPFLEACDPDGLVRYLDRHWPHSALRDLFFCENDDAVKVAAACLTLVGTMGDNRLLAPLLHVADTTTAAVAEHAMWSIWFRSTDPSADASLQHAVRLISQNELDAAVECLDHLVLRSPHFAEAFNQRAIAYFLKEAYAESLSDCLRTLRLNPFHFGAMAGVGHCHASFGRLQPALAAYSRALNMNPRMDGVRQSVHHIRRKLTTAVPAASSPP